MDISIEKKRKEEIDFGSQCVKQNNQSMGLLILTFPYFFHTLNYPNFLFIPFRLCFYSFSRKRHPGKEVKLILERNAIAMVILQLNSYYKENKN